jgi:hypothetical protein
MDIVHTLREVLSDTIRMIQAGPVLLHVLLGFVGITSAAILMQVAVINVTL